MDLPKTSKSARVKFLSANPKKWSSTIKKFVGKLLTNFLSVFDHFVELALKRLILTEDNSWKLNLHENNFVKILIHINNKFLLKFLPRFNQTI